MFFYVRFCYKKTGTCFTSGILDISHNSLWPCMKRRPSFFHAVEAVFVVKRGSPRKFGAFIFSSFPVSLSSVNTGNYLIHISDHTVALGFARTGLF